jgi:site-specific recombinase XerD
LNDPKDAAHRAVRERELERKPTTLGDCRSMLGRHVNHFFGEKPLERIDADEIRRYLAAKRRKGRATKTITNQLVFLHGLFALQEWMGHRDYKTTEIYAGYAPVSRESEMIDRAFRPPSDDDGESDGKGAS